MHSVLWMVSVAWIPQRVEELCWHSAQPFSLSYHFGCCCIFQAHNVAVMYNRVLLEVWTILYGPIFHHTGAGHALRWRVWPDFNHECTVIGGCYDSHHEKIVVTRKPLNVEISTVGVKNEVSVKMCFDMMVCKSPLCLDRWTTRLRCKKFTVRFSPLLEAFAALFWDDYAFFLFHMGPSKEKSEFICLQLKWEAGKNTMFTGMFLLFCSSFLLFFLSFSPLL